MDQSSYRKRKMGFSKAKLVMSMYRSKPPAAASPGPGGSVGTFVINREITTAPPPKQKVAFAGGGSTTGGIDGSSLQYRRKFESIYGVPGDDKVDLKAATYISSVQERFRRDECHVDTTATHLVHAT